MATSRHVMNYEPCGKPGPHRDRREAEPRVVVRDLRLDLVRLVDDEAPGPSDVA
jgi:hypothetical protein